MRVLFVSPVVPWPPESGGRQRTWSLIRALASHVELHLRAVLEPGQAPDALDPLRPFCATALGFERDSPDQLRRWTRARIERWFHSPSLAEHLSLEIDSGAFDLVHLDEPLLARSVPARPRIPVVVHHHKLDTVLHEFLPARSRWHRSFDVWKLHRLESETARLSRHHVVCSALDGEILRRRYPELELGVVESGFDPEHFAPTEPAPARAPDRILFVGSMGYHPNVVAVQHFVRDTLPLLRAAAPAVRLEVVGGDPPPRILSLAGPHVVIAGLVSDVRPYLERTGAFVAPISIGGGTRLKLVEALAMGCPVVSTSVGAEGLAFENGRHLWIADDPRAFAGAVLEALSRPDEAVRRGAAARAFALEHYRWCDLARRLLAFWERAARNGRS